MTARFQLIDDGAAHEVDAVPTPRGFAIPEADVRSALGWKLEERGLCRAAVCIPVPDREALVGEEGLDLATLAGLLGRPLAVDAEAKAAALGTAAADRTAALVGGRAPDFRLPDLEGRMHALSEHRGKKVLLIAYASW
jgi:hypothetical protein